MGSTQRLLRTAVVCVAAGIGGGLIVILVGLVGAYPLQVLLFATGATTGILIRSGHVRRSLNSARQLFAALAAELDLGRRTFKP